MEKKTFIIILLLLIARLSFCQDTIKISLLDFLICENFEFYPDKNRIDNKKVSKEQFACFSEYCKTKLATLICDKISGKFIQILNSKNQVLEEGIFYEEGFKGNYRNFYDDGKIAVEGLVCTDKLSTNYLTRTGIWKYYKKNGQLKKTVDFDKKKKRSTQKVISRHRKMKIREVLELTSCSRG